MKGLRLLRVTGEGLRQINSVVSIPKVVVEQRQWGCLLVQKRYNSGIRGVKATPWPLKRAVKEDANLATASGRRHFQKAYIALGSNLGDRIGWIEKACQQMDARGIRVVRTSSLWETKPMYVLDQDEFVNGVCEVETDLKPIALLDQLQDIENSLGRKKIIDKGPRNIDLDILLMGDQTFKNERLTIPHASLTEREFTLRPLAELIPYQPLDSAKPWTLCQDYLNALPPAETPMSTMTPISATMPPLRVMQADRQTRIMAILNCTPDSFSDGGKHRNKDLLETVAGFMHAGATIIDIGGQSTAPGAPEVSAEEEIQRVVPVVEQIRCHKTAKNVVVSIDTYRASVAQASVAAGVDIINDVSAGQMDPDMLKTVGRAGKTICLMHMRGTPETMNAFTDYSPAGLIPTIAQELLSRVAEAEAAGIRRWRIVLDPGLGFAKTLEQNLEILRRLDELRDWPGLRGLPWLVGSSRKKFVGSVTGVEIPKERVFGTAATVTAAVQAGADVVRVHDVKEMTQVVKMADAIWRVQQ